MSLFIQPAPVQSLHHPLFEKHGVQVMIKREDLLHNEVSGNKWRKLKYNLNAAREQGLHRVLTFGGAYSNHLYATAAACHSLGFESIGVVRGEPKFPLNSTLFFCVKNGMHLHFVSRNEYRKRDENGLIERLHAQYSRSYFVPEGGANALGVSGCVEILDEVHKDFDVVTVACGTGSTLAGLVLALKDHQKAIGFSALKGGEFLEDEVIRHAQSVLKNPAANAELSQSFRIETNYHFGGYGKMKPELAEFMEQFYIDHKIRLDPVYTNKMVYGLYDMIGRGEFSKGTRILMIHSGGLQGLNGFSERFGMNFYT